MDAGMLTPMGDGERIEFDQLFEIIAEPGRIVSVPPGEELSRTT